MEEPTQLQVSLPLSKHTADSLRNLIFAIYAKGELISKAVGGRFNVADGLADELQSGRINSVADVLKVITDAGPDALYGISFDEEKVTFDGFPETSDPKEIKAWTTLVAAINRAAIKQHRIRPVRTEEPNEKFAFRVWLTRLGLNGPDLKEERKVLYKNLSGHTAFRTEADADKWKTRQAEKKLQLKEQKRQAEAADAIQSL